MKRERHSKTMLTSFWLFYTTYIPTPVDIFEGISYFILKKNPHNVDIFFSIHLITVADVWKSTKLHLCCKITLLKNAWQTDSASTLLAFKVKKRQIGAFKWGTSSLCTSSESSFHSVFALGGKEIIVTVFLSGLLERCNSTT